MPADQSVLSQLRELAVWYTSVAATADIAWICGYRSIECSALAVVFTVMAIGLWRMFYHAR